MISLFSHYQIPQCDIFSAMYFFEVPEESENSEYKPTEEGTCEHTMRDILAGIDYQKIYENAIGNSSPIMESHVANLHKMYKYLTQWHRPNFKRNQMHVANLHKMYKYLTQWHPPNFKRNQMLGIPKKLKPSPDSYTKIDIPSFGTDAANVI